MGASVEVAEVMAALVAGRPVTVMSDGGLAPNHRDGGSRMFGVAALPDGGEATTAGGTDRPVRRVRSERLDRPRRVGR
ncbi:hypothetical protein [Umezawaea tangerina]|nr:hypothetical protein [Umezawaea tangerina]